MSAATLAPDTAATEPQVTTPISWKWPITYTVLAVLTLGVFVLASPADAQTTFRFSTSSDLVRVPDLALPARTASLVAGLLLLAIAAYSAWATATRRRLGWWVPALAALLFVAAFLLYSGTGGTGLIPLTALLAGGLALSVPLIFGAMCGLVGERSGIVNIAIEGQLLLGAFFAAIGASLTGSPYVGLITAPIAGALIGAMLVFFAVKYWVDQIIIGVVLNVLVLGLTDFLYSTVLTQHSADWNTPMRLPSLPIPLLSEIPVVGPVLFNQTILVYLMYATVILLQVFVFRSRWGLRMRAVGEHPKAADTVGIDVNATRVRNTIGAGALAGLGGAAFTVGAGLAFGSNISAGSGFIALAAMILGNWVPVRALFAALLFGFSQNLANMLSSIGTAVPTEILRMLPYLITILAVAGFVGRVRAPAAENIPYVK